MPHKAIPNTIQEYFQQFLDELPSASRLIIALDPARLLDLGQKIPNAKGKKWTVFHYCENDLSFRAKYARKPDDPNFPHIIWVTFPRFGYKSKINLSFIPDLLMKADRIEDFSLSGILSHLIPSEKWSSAEALFKYTSTISSHLSRFVSAHAQLRHHIPKETPLNIHHLRILVLMCIQPNISIQEVKFENLSASEVLTRYLKLVWSRDWDSDSLTILRELATQSPKVNTATISPWFDQPPQTVALYVYLRQVMEKYHVSNPSNQVRGLQMLDFDPTELEEETLMVMAHLEQDSDLCSKMIELAEGKLSTEDLDKLVEIVLPEDTPHIKKALVKENFPALLSGLVIHFLSTALTSTGPSNVIANSNIGQILASKPILPQAHYSNVANEALALISELSNIEEALRQPFEPVSDLGALVDWYTKGKAYQLELHHSKARQHVRALGHERLQRNAQEYLAALLNRIYAYLEKADLNLANIIESDWQGYIFHPRLSINVLKNTILRPEASLQSKARVWVLVFDGMRWDTWEEIVKPVLTEAFEITDENAYLCALPSQTDIARVSLLSGNTPLFWRDYKGNPTSDPHILVAKLFNILEKERHERLRIITGSETDSRQQQLDLDHKPYNILIYNLSDDWIHTFRDSVWELNKVVERKMKGSVLPDLRNRVQEEDVVVVTSDHGFIELSDQNEIPIKASTEWQRLDREGTQNFVSYRYLQGIEHPKGVKVQYGKDKLFTVAKKRNWFRREKGKPARYAHGGISLPEMIVPGAIIKRIVTPAINFQFSSIPDGIEATEDDSITIEIKVKNNGNRRGEFALSLETDTGDCQRFQQSISPKHEYTAAFTFTPKLSKNLKTSKVTCKLSYIDAAGKQQRLPAKVIPIEVVPRKDKVELDLSGLEKLDEV